MTNLLEFLTQRGKYLPLPLDKAATVVSTRGHVLRARTATAERLVFADWKPKTFEGVPFHLVDPQGDRVPNVDLLYSPQRQDPAEDAEVGERCRATRRPRRSTCSAASAAGATPYSEKGTVSMIVRLHYADGKTEDHALKNGEHFADYIRRVDVPGSKFAFDLRGQQMRYLAVEPKRTEKIKEIEFVKGPDGTAPVVMAVTVEAAK